jgi:hypothetical protein
MAPPPEEAHAFYQVTRSEPLWARDLGGRRSIECRKVKVIPLWTVERVLGVGGGDADEYGGPGAKRSLVLSEFGEAFERELSVVVELGGVVERPGFRDSERRVRETGCA